MFADIASHKGTTQSDLGQQRDNMAASTMPREQMTSFLTSSCSWGDMVQVHADYRVGSCYHCLINVPPGSLTAWILLFIFSIGWATTSWLGVDKGKELLQWPQAESALSYDDTALIAVSIATVVIASVFLIIATFSSQKMSRYSFTSSRKNKFGYCLSVTVIVLTFLCVIFWTAIIGLTMVPVSVLSLIHVLVNGDSLDCLHLPSYGIQMTNTTDMVSDFNTSVGAMSNVTTTTSSADSAFYCGSDLDSWMEKAWRTLVPLLMSLAFAVAIEGCMMGFMVAASSNARHLRERMAYINEPYTYSSENINGNVKPVGQDKPVTNNNQSDTQI